METSSTILIIDDEPALLLGLATRIKRQGYQVVTASNGNDGLQKAKAVLPDLILSDVMMPPPNGFELRRLMAQDPKLADIPFIFLTARSGVEDRVNGIRDGADDYITKPFVTEELLARIEAVLRRVRTAAARGSRETQERAQQDMENLKREILQNFQHEMRTPLANIVMPLELVVNQKFTDPEEQIQFVRMALSSVDRLESLVTDFTLLTDLDSGGLNRMRQRVDLNHHVLTPLQKRLERYTDKHLSFTYEVRGEGEIKAPRRELTHALVHLLDNAFKFSPDNGRVRFLIEMDTDGGAGFDVKDEGPGLSADAREHAFERYYQGSRGDTRERGGLGVGLFLAHALFNGLGGNVLILEGDGGCHVRATLPNLGPEDISYG